MAKEMEWDERLNIGIDSIDHAHRKLFSIVRKLTYLSKNDTKYDIVGAFFMCIQERREVMAKFQKTKDEEDTMIENYIY